MLGDPEVAAKLPKQDVVEEKRVVLQDQPTGVELELQFYHAKSGYLSEVTIDGKATKWSRGKVSKVIAEGENDMGEIKIAPAAFQ